MLQKLALIVVLFSLSLGNLQAQATDPKASNPTDPKKVSEADAKLEKDAIEFLKETSVDVGRLRSMENRISFSSELASLMWFHDEKEAKAMYGQVVLDFKQLLTQFDAEMNTTSIPGDDDEMGGGFLFGGGGRSKVQRKFRIAMAVRQQIALSLAEHAPDLAYNFFVDSIAGISNAEFRKEAENSDKYFEANLVQKIAESDAAKGAAYGKESIKRGIDYNHIELLRKIYEKDADQGIEFGAAILSRIKSDKSSVKGLYIYSSLLRFGATNLEASKKSGAKKPIYSSNDLRDLAEQFALAIIEDSTQEGANAAVGYVSQIEKYVPGRAAQIRAKFKSSMPSNSAIGIGSGSGGGIGDGSVSTAANAVPIKAVGNSNSAMTPWEKEQKERKERELAEKKLMDDIKGIGTKELPKEERERVIAQARKIISETKGKDKKIAALSLLAAQVSKMGDKELAEEIMRDADRLVNPNPKNYLHYLSSWMLAGGYAEVNPDKAFSMLESTIMRANETIGAFVKVAEFIDVQEELIDDGEVQVGMFGGQMIRGLTGELGMASGTIRSLIKADFNKTKALTNTFDRAEISVLAKMMVLRAALDKGTTKTQQVGRGDVDVVMSGDDDPNDPR